MTAADIIKSTLSMPDIIQKYGFNPNRAGFISCPFHENDHTPSLKIYTEVGRGYYCHACNSGGSIIDFVMQLFHIDFQQAIVRIAADFGLNICTEKPDRRAIDEWRREQAAKESELQKYRDEYDQKVTNYRRLWWALNHKAPPFHGEEPDPEWVEAVNKLPYLDYWFSENHYR